MTGTVVCFLACSLEYLLFKPQEPHASSNWQLCKYVSLCMFCVLLYDAMQRNRPFWGHSFRTTLGRFSVLLFIFMYLMIYLVNDAHICTGLSLLCYWVVQTMFHVLIKIYLTNLINTLTEKCLLLFYVNHVIIFFYINIIL